MALNSLTDKLSGRIEYVVTRRQQNWDYLKRAHQGSVHWLNVLHLSKSLIIRSMAPEKLQKRIRRWFMLGISLGRILELCEGATLVRVLLQLIEEYEYFISMKLDIPQVRTNEDGSSSSRSNQSSQKESEMQTPFLYLGSTPSQAVATIAVSAAQALGAQQDTQSSTQSSSGKESSKSVPELKPTLKKIGKEVQYEYLQLHSLCLAEYMDYCECVHSLCDVLSLIYSKFLDASCQPTHIHDAILRIDRKLKALVLTKIITDLSNDVAAPAMKREISNQLNHMFIDERATAMATMQSLGQAGSSSTRKFIQLAEGAGVDGDEDEDD